MRDFLFYTACNKGVCEAELFGTNRLYDVAVNDYTSNNINPQEAEYKFSTDEYKFRHIYNELHDIVINYKAVAIFDDDVKITTSQINDLFIYGTNLDLNLWQAALSHDSVNYWEHLFAKPNSRARSVNTIEIMMPIFSNNALKLCLDSFIINYSAWGLDVAWNHLLSGEKIMVIDDVVVKHMRPYQGHLRIMPNGKTPLQDADLVFDHYNITRI